MFLGFIFALLSAIFLSLYIVPKKFSKLEPCVYNLFIGIGYFLTSIIFVVILVLTNNFHEEIFSVYALYSVLDGILWVLASICFLKCIDTLGITRASTFKNLQGPISAILFLFILSEYKSLNVGLIFIALILIFISQFLFNFNSNSEQKLSVKGMIYGILASIFFSFNALVRKVCALHNLVYIGQVYASLTIVILSFIILLFKNKINKKVFTDKQNKYGYLSGIFYFFASMFMVLSYSYISGTITSTITKLSGLITIFIGIVFFKEIDFKKHYVRILLGSLSIILAVAILFFA